MGLYLDFHYSDNFADPAQQTLPAAWVGLSFSQLTDAIYQYTHDSLVQLVAAGARPDMVQLGNEITGGILWDAGKTYSPDNRDQLAVLLKSAVRAVRDIDSQILVAMHLDPCGKNEPTVWWVDSMLQRGLTFDVLGESCYVQWQGPPSNWQANFDDLKTRYPTLSFLASEYSQEKRAVHDIQWALGVRGLGAFIWEPTTFDEVLFTASGNDMTTNSLI